MYKNSNNKSSDVNYIALSLSIFVHSLLVAFLFWNIQWKNNQETLQTIEVELYSEIPGNAATQKDSKSEDSYKTINSKTPIVAKNIVKQDDLIKQQDADIALQKQKDEEEKKRREKEKLEKLKLLEQQRLEKEKLEQQKQKELEIAKAKELEKQKLEKQKQQEKLAKLEKEKKEKAEKEKNKKEIKKDWGDELAAESKTIENQKAIASDKNRDGNIDDKTRGGVGNVTGRNVSGNTMKKVKARNLDAYIAKIQNIVRSKVVLPPNVEGNPEMLLNVRQSQNGTILSVKITQSSGNELLDKAVIAAFHKSSPLPLPDDPDDFESILNVKYRPFN